MTHQPGSPTAADLDLPVGAGSSDEQAPYATSADAPTITPGVVILTMLALSWLAAMLWSTRAAIDSAQAGTTALSLSAYALPGVISAALVSGAAVALTVTALLARPSAARPTLRFVAATGAGFAVGLLTAVAINLFFPDSAVTNVIAATTAAAAVIGGTVAGTRHTPVIGAAVSAAVAVLVFVVAFSLVRDPLSALYGADQTQESVVDAARWVSRTESLLAGLVAGLLAFALLRRSRRRLLRRQPDAAPERWPAYLVAGAGPGLLLLLNEVIIRVGGRALLDLAASLSEADAVAQTALGTSRIDNGIWILVVGAFTALVAFGRTLGPASSGDDDDDDATPKPDDRPDGTGS